MVGTNVYVAGGADVERSVIIDNVRVGRGAVVRNAILDKNVVVPDGAEIGVDQEADRARGFHGQRRRRHRARQGPARAPVTGAGQAPASQRCSGCGR